MKALAVFSGGLDSMLATQLIMAQEIEVLGLFFETPFFHSGRAVRSAEAIHLPLKVIDLTERHLGIVKKPKHGYGGNMNPCIDCHALMLRVAGERLDQEGASFIITGEVLGQRPMSQNLRALSTVAAESGFQRLILRPLSAKHLPITLPEERGWVKRDKLMGFTGRSRKPQMELALSLGVIDYPSPAGGCLLTDRIFSHRLKDLLTTQAMPEIREIKLLKLGRHFRIGPRTKMVVGRNERENEVIFSLSDEKDLLLRTDSVPGPTSLVLGVVTPELEETACLITASYSDARKEDMIDLCLSSNGVERAGRVRTPDKAEFRGFMVQKGEKEETLKRPVAGDEDIIGGIIS